MTGQDKPKLRIDLGNAMVDQEKVQGFIETKAPLILEALLQERLTPQVIAKLNIDADYLKKEGYKRDPRGNFVVPDFGCNRNGERQLRVAKQAGEFARQIHGQFEEVWVVGIGGSSLGAKASFYALTHPFHNYLSSQQRKGWPKLFFVGEDLSAPYLSARLSQADLEKVLVVYISKSGTTLESATHAGVIFAQMKKQFGKRAYQHFVAISASNTSLYKLGEKFLMRWKIPEFYEGRYSVSSAVGLVPMALAGINVEEFIKGSIAQSQEILNIELQNNPTFLEAAVRVVASLEDKSQNKKTEIIVEYPYDPRLEYVAHFMRQCWNESLGGKGSKAIPFCTAGLGPRDNHSDLQYIEGKTARQNLMVSFYYVIKPEMDISIPEIFPGALLAEKFSYLAESEITLGQENFYSFLGTEAALTEAGVRNYTTFIPVLTPFTWGKLLTQKMAMVMIASLGRGIIPFGQPNVESYKSFTAAACGDLSKPGARQRAKKIHARAREIKHIS